MYYVILVLCLFGHIFQYWYIGSRAQHCLYAVRYSLDQSVKGISNLSVKGISNLSVYAAQLGVGLSVTSFTRVSGTLSV